MGNFSLLKLFNIGENPIVETFRDKMKFWMEKRGFNQKSLATAAGLNETAVRDILKENSQNPRIDTVIKLCATLKITPDQLIPTIRQLYPPKVVALLEELEALDLKEEDVQKKIAALKGQKPS